MGVRPTVLKKIEVSREWLDWFRAEYPGSSLTWIVSMLLQEFKDAHHVTPKGFATTAANETKDQIEDEEAAGDAAQWK